MDVQQVLKIPKGEIIFLHPRDAPNDRFDPRFKTLRSDLGRRGLREWRSFEKKPDFTKELLTLPTTAPLDWLPQVEPWDRYAGCELSVVDLLKKTLIQRVNIALRAATASRGTRIVGTPRHFSSYGTYDNRNEGGVEKRIGPDLVVLDGDPTVPPSLKDLQRNIVTVGDVKLKDSRMANSACKILPGTVGCYESWLAQPVQCCLDLGISTGFLLTNVEMIVFHLVKYDHTPSQTSKMALRSANSPMWETLPSDATQEVDFSSPDLRQTDDWVDFHLGDSDIPYISVRDSGGPTIEGIAQNTIITGTTLILATGKKKA